MKVNSVRSQPRPWKQAAAAFHSALLFLVILPLNCFASVAPSHYTNSEKSLTLETMNINLKKMEYAVRGKVVIAADKIEDELQKQISGYGSSSSTTSKDNNNKKNHFDFDHIVKLNIGNPHSVGQKELTWPRQVMALVDLPDEVGIYHPDAPKLFPSDAMKRAQQIKTALAGSGTGAYSHSKGVKCFREDVAHFIEKRDDGLAADPENIFLLNGASAGIVMILTTLIANPTW